MKLTQAQEHLDRWRFGPAYSGIAIHMNAESYTGDRGEKECRVTITAFTQDPKNEERTIRHFNAATMPWKRLDEWTLDLMVKALARSIFLDIRERHFWKVPDTSETPDTGPQPSRTRLITL